jgi:hypothetical protein
MMSLTVVAAATVIDCRHEDLGGRAVRPRGEGIVADSSLLPGIEENRPQFDQA